MIILANAKLGFHTDIKKRLIKWYLLMSAELSEKTGKTELKEGLLTLRNSKRYTKDTRNEKLRVMSREVGWLSDR